MPTAVGTTPQFHQGGTLQDPTDPPPTPDTWFRCDASANNCQPIAGATGASYTLAPEDVGHTIAVADDSTGTTSVIFPQLQSVVIDGTDAEGQTLTANPEWSTNPVPPGATFTYTWSRCNRGGTACHAVQSGSSPQYLLTSSDVGHTIEAAVTDSEPSGDQQRALDDPGGTVSDSSGASSTSILTAPATATTNHPVTMIATVTAMDPGRSPSGTVAFANRGAVLPGCDAVPASASGQSVTVTCDASFPAATSPEQLTATFTPASGSSVTSSTSPPLGLEVARDTTTSTIAVTGPTVVVGHQTTFTAAIQGSTPGPAEPTGGVTFFDAGKPITGCGTPLLIAGAGASIATCTVRYTRPGAHSISVSFPGDANFAPSSSGASPVTARSVSLGSVGSTMEWSFHFTRAYTRVLSMLVDSVSPGMNVMVRCKGHGCPFSQRRTTIVKSKRCRKKGLKRVCQLVAPRSLSLAPLFRTRRLARGARIRIYLTRRQWTGKYYEFTIRSSAPPGIRIACLAPGSTSPGSGC